MSRPYKMFLIEKGHELPKDDSAFPITGSKPPPKKGVQVSVYLHPDDHELLKEYYRKQGLSKLFRKLARRTADRIRVDRGRPPKGDEF